MGIREDIRKQLEGLNQDELLQVLRDAGFNVTKGTGKITINDDNEQYD